ncbi:vomeronasal type-2 receptor 26-like [Leptodactylus fuscus]|uniref:vomeronasal type-2 receptor 26-like n=1 Tax=Leptodactylus fuscus TaxID=238119 RepID=UPI003F4E487C
MIAIKNKLWGVGRGRYSNVSIREYQQLMAFIFVIDEINRSPDILPNVTLGYHVFDSCGHINKVIKDVLRIMSGIWSAIEIPNYSYKSDGALAGYIGDLHPLTTNPMAQLLSIFGYTQISYGARDPRLSNRRLYPNFFRTVQDYETQNEGTAKLIKTFGWNWVGIITTDDDPGEREAEHMSQTLRKFGICIEFKFKVSLEDSYVTKQQYQLPLTCEIIIICGTYSFQYMRSLTPLAPFLKQRTILLPVSWSFSTELVRQIAGDKLDRSLVFSPPPRHVPGLKELLYTFHPSNRPDDKLLEDIWISFQFCLSGNKIKNKLFTAVSHATLRNCTGGETYKGLLSYFGDSMTYNVYVSALSMAHALHDLYTFLNRTGGKQLEPITFQHKLRIFMKKLKFFGKYNEPLNFNERGEMPEYLEIENWVKRESNVYNTTQYIGCWDHVGYFNPSVLEHEQLVIYPQKITWKHGKIPLGLCSESCFPGTLQSPKESHPSCCHDCLACPAGQISNISGSKTEKWQEYNNWVEHFFRPVYGVENRQWVMKGKSTTNSETCLKCPDDQWPNEYRDECMPKIIEYLSYEQDTMAVVLSSMFGLFLIITISVSVIFIIFLDTPIVKANNRNISFILLLSLKLSLLCVFLFIGRPDDITCRLRQISTGVAFTVAVSSILAKSITVSIAFKATRPGSPWRRYLGVRLPYSVVLVGSFFQLLNGIIWLSVSPPFQELDIDSYPGRIIIQCNEGSVLAFYVMLGYLGVLAAVSFVLAFMVRTLPDIYNEAKYITFSMLVFCSVWICAIPAYLSSKGKNMVMVEIFSILASEMGILGCIFLPKCYNIIMRPEMSSRRKFLERQ